MKLADVITEYAHIHGYAEDTRLPFVSKLVVQAVLNFCNLSILPKQLYYLVAEMVIEVAASLPPLADADDPNPIPELPEREIDSIKVGDVTVGYAKATGEAPSKLGSVSSAVETVIKDYKEQLYNFRRVKW